MDVIETFTTDEFVRTSAEWIKRTLLKAAEGGRCPVVGLSGGSTPQPVYAVLAADASLPWNRIRFFLVDERYVPADHSDSNQRMIRETLLQHAAAPVAFLAPDTSKPLPDCIAGYSQALVGVEPSLVILGMGPDGHIASLFPPLDPAAFGPANVIRTETDCFTIHDRISVTLPILESAEKRLFLITGSGKRTLLRKMQEDVQDVTMHPAIALFDERTMWIIGPDEQIPNSKKLNSKDGLLGF